MRFSINIEWSRGVLERVAREVFGARKRWSTWTPKTDAVRDESRDEEKRKKEKKGADPRT